MSSIDPFKVARKLSLAQEQAVKSLGNGDPAAYRKCTSDLFALQTLNVLQRLKIITRRRPRECKLTVFGRSVFTALTFKI